MSKQNILESVRWCEDDTSRSVDSRVLLSCSHDRNSANTADDPHIKGTKCKTEHVKHFT